MSAIEEAFLGSCLCTPEKIPLFSLSQQDFDDRELGKIWADMQKGVHDPASLLEAHPDSEHTLQTCIGSAYTSAIDKHAAAISEAAKKRDALASLSNAYKLVDGGADVTSVVSNILLEAAGGAESGFKPISEVITDVYNGLGSAHEKRFIPTGFPSLDFVIGGLERKSLIIVAGRPGSGKTSLGMSMCIKASEEHNVCISSIEMDNESFGYRMMSSESKMDLRLLRTGMVKSREAWQKASGATNKICSYKIFIDDNPKKSASQIASQCRRHALKHGVDVLMVDYIGLLSPDNSRSSRERQIADASRTFKLLSKELDIVVILLCQLNREAEGVKPNKSHLRESGAIEQDADLILFPYREGEHAEIIVGKSRNGPCTSVDVQWDGSTASYRPLPNLN